MKINTLAITKKPTERKRLDETGNDFSKLIRESTVCVDEKGQPLIVYLELDDEHRQILDPLSDALSRIKYQKSGRTGGLPTTSRVFGYQPRIAIRRDFCTETSLNNEDPQAYRRIREGAALAAAYYGAHNPALLKRHEEQTGKVRKDWIIPGSPFTSGIINKNNRLRYHFDSGNFPNVWSAMFVFRQAIEGGHLSCPEYGVGFELKHNSLLLFDGQSILHGVTPIKKLWPNSHRISMVYYSLAGMWKCLSPEGEIQRIRKVRTARETKRAAS